MQLHVYSGVHVISQGDRVAFKPKADKRKPPRAKGEGSIFQRKDGMWVGSIELGADEHGKRKQKRVYSKSKASLVAKLDELKSDTAEGIHVDRSMTLAKWLDYWLPNVHRERIRPTTYSGYTFTCRNIAEVIGHKKLIELTPADVRRMQIQLGKGRRRAQKAHVLLNRALRDAVAEGLLKRNVVDAVDSPEVSKQPRDALNIQTVQGILNYARANRNQMEYTRWLLLFLTGTRQGESLGLTWDRVDLESGAIDITWQLQQLRRSHGCGEETPTGWPCGRKQRCPTPTWDMPIKFEYTPLQNSLALTRPKSEAGNRWVPIIEPLRVQLAKLKDADVGINTHGLVFHRADGSPVPPTVDTKAWHTLLRDAGVIAEGETLGMHSTRHTTATVLRAAGADEQTRMEILGHNSPEVTRIYAHADQAKNSTMMDALAVLVPPAVEGPS